jgi:hypothetical protein
MPLNDHPPGGPRSARLIGREPAESRTSWAEEQAAAFCSAPLTAETVFLRARYQKGGEKEVSDLVLALRGDAVLISLKHQEDPDERAGDRLTRWCGKAAKAAAGELVGAVRTLRERPFWCDHERRGRVEFAPGALQVRHAVAAVETFAPVALPADLPAAAHGIPVTYLASNDLLNLVEQLRSFPDLAEYLEARLKLPPAVRRVIGLEKEMFAYYVLNGETFDGCRDLREILAALAANARDVSRQFDEKRREDHFARVVERVSDTLAERAADYAEGLDAATVAQFDSDRRSNYIALQEHLCDLRLPERRKLGKGLIDLGRRVAERQTDMVYRVVYSDRKDFLYVLAATRDLARPEVLHRAELLMAAGLAHYGKTNGMVIVDRESKGFEVGLGHARSHQPEAIAAGRELFGHLRMVDEPLRLLPEEEI